MDRDFFNFKPSSQIPSWKLMPEINTRFNTFESNMNSITSSPVSNTPPKLSWPIMDKIIKENTPIIRNSIPVGPGLPSLVSDPGFAERAAKFSYFGSKSFNGRTSQYGLNSINQDLQVRSSGLALTRVSSSPLLHINGSNMGIQDTRMANRLVHDHKSNSNEEQESSISEHIEIGLKNANESGSRKRKGVALKGKAKDVVPPIVKEEENDEMKLKRAKKIEDDANDETEKKIKIREPPKEYIYVRARRGQATDSHSLSERVRREKISERMKLLQDLVPGCNKVTGKALMLDEIINYIQSLQHQVEFLSMKLATVNPRQDLDMNGHISKDSDRITNSILIVGNSMNQTLYPIKSSTSDFYQQKPQQIIFIGSTPITQSSVDQLPTIHGFAKTFSQFSGFEGDDLHSIVKMGFGDSSNQSSETKIEL